MNFILGSGVIGYLAKKILGWSFIPFKRSRYYTFEVPWADNHIVYDEVVDQFMSTIMASDMAKVIFKRPMSYKGQLFFDDQPELVDLYLDKIYGEDIPAVAKEMFRPTFMTYPVTVKALHDALYEKYITEINNSVKSPGELEGIDLRNRKMKFKGGHEVGYERLLSTIPLNALCRFCGITMPLESKTVIYYRIIAKTVDLENAQQALICDHDIAFFKVQQIGENDFVFWTFEILDNAFDYFGAFLGYGIDVMEAARIEDAFPLGDPPDLSVLERGGITCVGSNAQWDDFMDVASCIKRLLGLTGDQKV